MTEESRRRVAVACQGGGSHTAFTAGVLDRLLAEPDAAEIVGLTGTSGGGICAFLAWYGLVSEASEEAGRERARALLAQVWDDIAATDPMVAATNRVGVWWAHARDGGLPLPVVSPDDSAVSVWTSWYLRRALERAVPPEELARVVATLPETAPTLHLGAVDVERGTFRTFTEREVTIDAVLASAAVPTLFSAASVEGESEERRYWDGLFSQNPPVRDLLAGVSTERKPEEIWLVRINPQRREGVPTTLRSIADRRNELGGNLSVNQELAFIRRVNEWVAEGALSAPYQQVAVRCIGLDEDRLADAPLTAASKLDCRPAFLDGLRREGARAATAFLDAERNRRLVRGTVEALWNTESPAAGVYLAEDFELHATEAGTDRGPAAYEAYVERVKSALDGLELDVETDLAEGDRVALVWVARGRHTGRLFGREPSDEDVTVRGVEIARVVERDGDPVVAESWLTVDDGGLRSVADTTDGPATPAATATPVVSDMDSAAEAREVAVRHAEQLWGDDRRTAAVARELVAPDHVFRRTGDDIEGRDEYVAFVQSYRDAFPDLRVSVRDVVAEGDRVVVRAVMTGCHRAPFEGIEPSGRRVEARWTFVHELAAGRIVATGMGDDRRWLRDQLSARPLSAPDRTVDVDR